MTASVASVVETLSAAVSTSVAVAISEKGGISPAAAGESVEEAVSAAAVAAAAGIESAAGGGGAAEESDADGDSVAAARSICGAVCDAVGDADALPNDLRSLNMHDKE